MEEKKTIYIVKYSDYDMQIYLNAVNVSVFTTKEKMQRFIRLKQKNSSEFYYLVEEQTPDADLEEIEKEEEATD